MATAVAAEPSPAENDDINNNSNESSGRVAISVDDEQQEWSQLMHQMAVTLDPKEYVQTFWNRGARPDGRLFSQTRPTQIQKGVFSNGGHHNNTRNNINSNSSSNTRNSNSHIWGSALVTLGDTRVLAAVTCAIGQATRTNTNDDNNSTSVCGDVAVALSFASGDENDNASKSAAPLEAYVQRLLDETLALEQLSLAPFKEALEQQSVQQRTSLLTNGGGAKKGNSPAVVNWNLMALRLHVTIQVLHPAGNLWDAAILASVAALADTTLPATAECFAWDATAGRLAMNSTALRTRPFQLPKLPIPLTLGLWCNRDDKNKHVWITDPTRLEEESGLLPSALTVVVNGNNNNKSNSNENDVELVSLEYSGHDAISVEQDLLVALHMAQARAQEVQGLLLQ